MKSLFFVCLFFCLVSAISAIDTCGDIYVHPCTRKFPCPPHQYCDGKECCLSKRPPHNAKAVPMCPPGCWQCNNDPTACCGACAGSPGK
uniref:Uncharacterized protein n=1 Tax=Panagrolaimus superbus TaxID=310955 RepID=A0A914Z8Y2_9BILA